MIAVLCVAALGVALSAIRRRLAPGALALVAALTLAGLAGCPTAAPAAKTTQEVYPMTSDGTTNWFTGVVFTTTVKLNADPGTYNFQFMFDDSIMGAANAGTALGVHTVTIN